MWPNSFVQSRGRIATVVPDIGSTSIAWWAYKPRPKSYYRFYQPNTIRKRLELPDCRTSTSKRQIDLTANSDTTRERLTIERGYHLTSHLYPSVSQQHGVRLYTKGANSKPTKVSNWTASNERKILTPTATVGCFHSETHTNLSRRFLF